ncbi:MAG: PAS domain S-box protein [Candidatus Methanofastidiosum sp.]|nr:PAS domain S-box protein [Methanofastidiosum sp.]
MEILIVEDNEEIAYLQEKILAANNYLVTRASNGQQALELLAYKKYDMIISDILMPVMDGFQLCKTLKNDPKTKDLPFVFYSASYTEKKDKEFALKLGADIYVETPIEPDEFIKIINNYFENFKEGKIKPREYLFEKENNMEKIYSERLARQLEKKLVLLEKKMAENNELMKKLKQSEERYRELVENVNSIITKYDVDGNILSMNEYGLKFFGYKAEEIIGKNFIGTVTPPIDSTGKNLSFLLKDIFSDIERYSTNINENIKKNGERVWVYWANRLIVDGNGNYTGILSVGTDITERKKLEAEIVLLHNAVDQSPAIVIITDKDRKIEYVNPKFVEVTGFTSSEVIGRDASFLGGEPFSEENDREFLNTLSKGNEWQGEFKNIKKNGNIYWELASIAPVKTQSGIITHFVKVAEDITYRKLAEKELQEREETLKGILSAAPVGINYLQDRKFKWSNREMAEITGYSDEELVGKTPRFLFESNEEYERVGSILYDPVRDQDVIEVETNYKLKNGDTKDIYIRNSPLDIKDLSKGYITLVMDITDNKKSRKQLDENLEYFAHLIDHIRNPLAILSGFVQVNVEDEKTKDVVIRQVDRIEKLLKELDQGWMDTEETRKFLKRYM